MKVDLANFALNRGRKELEEKSRKMEYDTFMNHLKIDPGTHLFLI